MPQGDIASFCAIFIFDEGVNIFPSTTSPPHTPRGLWSLSHWPALLDAKEAEDASIKEEWMDVPGLLLARFTFQLNWDQSKVGFFLSREEKRNDFCGINWQYLSQTYVWLACNSQVSFCWFLSLLLRIQSLLLIIWSVQIHCFQDHVSLEAGWKKHSEFSLLCSSDGYAVIYLFSTDVYPVLMCTRPLGNNLKIIVNLCSSLIMYLALF